METNDREMRTSAKRKLVPESSILEIKYRVQLGVSLNTAVKLLLPDMSNVAAIKLVHWHTEMDEALRNEDFVLFSAMHASLFPSWVNEEQPDTACYIGQFPYGYWS